MRQRGRKSVATLAAPEAVEAVERPDAPYDLTDEQADVWRGTLSALPADWLEPGAHPVLAAYCRQTIALRRIGELMATAERDAEFSVSDHIALVKAHGQAAQVLKTLATSLRLTPQTRTHPDTAGRRSLSGKTMKRPWQ